MVDFEDYFRYRAACICVRNEEKEVLLVSSRKDKNKWILPGGRINSNEEPRIAAIREVKEEAGVIGKLHSFIGIFEKSTSTRKYCTYVYIFSVTEELSEWDDLIRIGRKRKWFPIKEALEVLFKPDEIECMKQFIHNRKLE